MKKTEMVSQVKERFKIPEVDKVVPITPKPVEDLNHLLRILRGDK
jgi:hypothetical protein